MGLLEHLQELRNRLVTAAIAVVLGTVGGFFVYQQKSLVLCAPDHETYKLGVAPRSSEDSRVGPATVLENQA